MTASPIKVGLIGTGFMGQNHLRHLVAMDHVEMVGIHDVIQEHGMKISQDYHVPFFTSAEDLIDHVDMIVVTVQPPSILN
ncbi:hypothetical protein GCM10011391_20510 [Pullulanibacillus camelliae]|uniref:Gfo/Idh/MocA-like oxidoreductase N-terminal domain-containing protein n=1 Tax=Pullulanibacillus camelliae TaxID=1707096 RepID=A0A8J2VNY6_9BACL|nr:Gfo/Idh/MocA family oxidoreductase [Pullulanibacillus camelliae]GGE41654.1 hypothetical protein GCM10011391_20510 [Pullulanibacillus camelliae]